MLKSHLSKHELVCHHNTAPLFWAKSKVLHFSLCVNYMNQNMHTLKVRTIHCTWNMRQLCVICVPKFAILTNSLLGYPIFSLSINIVIIPKLGYFLQTFVFFNWLSVKLLHIVDDVLAIAMLETWYWIFLPLARPCHVFPKFSSIYVYLVSKILHLFTIVKHCQQKIEK